jgi:radical SAM protein with 4Fe4S-binding SPASM domain
MTIDQFKLILDKIKGYTENIYLHVKGEPLLHKDIEEIIKLANKYNLNVNITTNGRLIKEKIDIINRNKIRQINLSLHSYDNLNDIKELLEVVDKINTKVSLRIWNNNLDIIKLIEEYYNIKVIIKKRSTIKDNIYLDIDEEFIWPDIKLKEITSNGTCYGLRRQIAILVDGTVVPCCLDQDGIIKLGNIFNEDLKDILNKEKTKKIIQGFRNNVLVEDLCKRCNYIERFNK